MMLLKYKKRRYRDGENCNVFKKVIILLCGIVLGYLTSRRTDMSISLECILGDGVFIVLVITIIMVITKEKIKLGINCAIFGLSFVIGSTWIKNIELF